MSRLIGGQLVGTAPQCTIGKRRIEAFNQGDNAPVSNFKNVNVLLVITRFCAGKATILRHRDDHLASINNDLIGGAECDVTCLHATENMRGHLFKKAMLAAINARQNMVLCWAD